VYLTENMRHAANPIWVKILDNWRKGIFLQGEIDYVNNYCNIEKPLPNDLTYCPFITASNTARVAMNRSATYDFALKNCMLSYFACVFCMLILKAWWKLLKLGC
jgi:hypothetical protein